MSANAELFESIKNGDLARVTALLDAEAEARCPSPPLRAAARRLGAGLLRTAATVWPESVAIAREALTVNLEAPAASGRSIRRSPCFTTFRLYRS